jgi:cysteine-rich repeat protein
MKKKHKKILTISLIVLAIGLIAYFGGFFSVIGWSNTLGNYSNKFHIQDTTLGNQITEAYLPLPTNTTNFSFTIDYSLTTYFDSGTDGQVFVSYEVYNYNTNQYERIHTKDWAIKNYVRDQSKLKMKGEEVYGTGIPQHFYALEVSQAVYQRYYGCLDGMTTTESIAMNPWVEGTSSYSYICLYPDNYLELHNYDEDEGWDTLYFPPLINLDTDYIKDDKSLFRISVNSKSNGLDSLRYNDFDIELWNIERNLSSMTVYRLIDNKCELYEIPNGQNLPTDYLSLEECQSHIIINPCGNGVLETNEQCDDGNIINDDGCSSTCQNEISPPNPNYWKFIGIILGLITFIAGLIFVLRRFKR